VRYLEIAPLTAPEVAPVGFSADMLWLRGGFPDSLLAPSDAASLRWRSAFIWSYLERDVPMFAPRVPSSAVGQLWIMLAHAQGTMLNLARLAQAMAVSEPTVQRYVGLLEDLLLVRRLLPWSGNLAKRLIRRPKLYIRGSGLVHTAGAGVPARFAWPSGCRRKLRGLRDRDADRCRLPRHEAALRPHPGRC